MTTNIINTSNTQQTPASWPEHSEEMQFSSQSINAHLEFARALAERIEHLGRICLKENLFDTTFLQDGFERSSAWRERNLSYWASSSISIQEMPESTEYGHIEFELSTYRGCGEYDTTGATLPASALGFENLEDFLNIRRARRDAYLQGLREEAAAAKEKAQQEALRAKRAQLEALRKELGEA